MTVERMRNETEEWCVVEEKSAPHKAAMILLLYNWGNKARPGTSWLDRVCSGLAFCLEVRSSRRRFLVLQNMPEAGGEPEGCDTPLCVCTKPQPQHPTYVWVSHRVIHWAWEPPMRPDILYVVLIWRFNCIIDLCYSYPNSRKRSHQVRQCRMPNV